MDTNNNNELNDIETIDIEDNKQPLNTTDNTNAEVTIPVDDINKSIPTDLNNNPQAQVLKAVEPKQKEDVKEKKKNNSLIPIIILFIFLFLFILFLPKLSELLTGI